MQVFHLSRFCTLLFLFTSTATALTAGRAFSEDAPESMSEVIKGIEFANVDEHRLKLDLYRPTGKHPAKLIVWVHGGAWRRGSRDNMPLGFAVRKGYAVASVDYRLSPVAKFPAQVHDIKAAIRFLRANQSRWNIDAENIVIAGSSAGGHLAALVGVTNNNETLEGTVGNEPDQSSSVQGIVDYYGPTNFETILQQSTPHGLSVRVPALKLLLGDTPENRKTLAKLASPVSHVDPKDPPLLMIHGDQDPQVPINQSHELHAAYKRKKLDVKFEVVHGGAHGGEQFHDATRQHLFLDFISNSVFNEK